jgi:hypothetical protein
MSEPFYGPVDMCDDRPLLTDAEVDSTAGGGLARTAGGMGDDRVDRRVFSLQRSFPMTGRIR